MENDYSGTRSFALTLAHRAVGDIRRGGFRQLRNYVDLCAILSKKTRFQQFFETAQEALERADSCYYGLIGTLIDTVDEDALCTFGVNLGFGSLVCGAGRQKNIAEQEKTQFSWVSVGSCDDANLRGTLPARVADGCCFWILDATKGNIAAAAETAKENPTAAIAVLTEPAALTEETMDQLAELKNLAVVPLLHSPELTTECCCAMRVARQRKMLCVLGVLMDEREAGAVTQPHFLDCLAQETSLCMVARKGAFAPDAAKSLRSWIVGTRREAGNPVLVLDWDADIPFINKALSPYAVLGNYLPADVGYPLLVAEHSQS